VRLQGRRNPSAPSGRKRYLDTFRGVAPGWHAPRRWRVIVAEFSSGGNFYEAIYGIASSIAGLKQDIHLPTNPSPCVMRAPLANSRAEIRLRPSSCTDSSRKQVFSPHTTCTFFVEETISPGAMCPSAAALLSDAPIRGTSAHGTSCMPRATARNRACGCKSAAQCVSNRSGHPLFLEWGRRRPFHYPEVEAIFLRGRAAIENPRSGPRQFRSSAQRALKMFHPGRFQLVLATVSAPYPYRVDLHRGESRGCLAVGNGPMMGAAPR